MGDLVMAAGLLADVVLVATVAAVWLQEASRRLQADVAQLLDDDSSH